MHDAPKILIISSDTGGGHRSAAAAIVAGVQKFFRSDSYAVRVVRSIEDSHHLTDRMVRCYNWVLRNRQQWMKYLYWCVNRFRPETRDFFYRRTIGYTREIFDRWCPHVVVSVHPLTQHALARLLKELGLADKIPLVTVVTDPCYGFWKGWACDDVTLYLVASEEARQQLIDYGVAPARIKISGMPVHPKFEMLDDRAAQAAGRMTLKPGETHDLDDLTRQFVSQGYEPAEAVESAGTFARRHPGNLPRACARRAGRAGHLPRRPQRGVARRGRDACAGG